METPEDKSALEQMNGHPRERILEREEQLSGAGGVRAVVFRSLKKI